MTQLPCPRAWRVLASLLGLTAVALGAIAAHALTDPVASAAVERASTYQLIHAVVLWLATLCSGWAARCARWALLAGMLLFCGAIYAKYLLSVSQAVAVAPAGGTLLMIGWLLLAISHLRDQNQTEDH